MSIENPFEQAAPTDAKSENAGENKPEILEGEEKAFAEFLEKQNEFLETIKPLLDLANKIAPDMSMKIAGQINYLAKTGHEKFSSIPDDRRREIETGLIYKWKAEGRFESLS